MESQIMFKRMWQFTHIAVKVKGMFLYSQYPVRWTAQSALYFSSPGIPVHSDTNSASLESILSMQQLRNHYIVFTHISTTVYSQVLIYSIAPFIVERGSSVVESRTRNREGPGSNLICYRFKVWAFSFSSRRLSRLSCINEYLAIDSGGHVSE